MTASTRNAGAEFMQLVQQIGSDKGIDVEILVSALEDAITTASRKQQERNLLKLPDHNRPSQEILVSRLNRQTGQLHLYARKLVVEDVTDENTEITLKEAVDLDPAAEPGKYVEIPRSTKGLGRIEAQAAKQVIFQKVREAERDIVYNEYAPRVGELVNGTVKQFERGEILVELGRAEGLVPRRYQSRTEMYSVGDRVRAVVVEVNRSGKGPQVLLSRTDSSLLVKLFEMEVPEIYDGTVLLRQAVREPGERSKVAVTSSQKDVDPVGACVGMKGSRVQAIIRELRGEKVDIVEWSEDITTFAANALNPAKVSRVSVSTQLDRTLEVVVDAMQLSLAIGKRGQNVRLGSKLVGWRVDIKSEDDKRKEVEGQIVDMARRANPLADVPGVSAKRAAELALAGITTVSDLLAAATSTLLEVGSLDEGSIEQILAATNEYLSAGPHVEAPPPTESSADLDNAVTSDLSQPIGTDEG